MKLTPKMRLKIQKFISSIFIYTLLLCLGFVILYPLFGRVMLSVMDEFDLYDDTVRFFTKRFTLTNYAVAVDYMKYWSSLVETVLFVILTSVCQVISSVVIAYGLARFKFIGNRLLFIFLLLTLIIPPQLISLPMYFRFQYFNIFGLLPQPISLMGNKFSIALLCLTGMGLKSGLLIFILQQYFRGFPKELEESAMIDGAGPLRTFFYIALPSTGPIITTAFLFSMVWQWTDNFYTSIFLPGNTLMPQRLLGLRSVLDFDTYVEGGAFNIVKSSLTQNAAVILFILPLLLVFIFAQRYFVESIENTGIVG
jgi:multiple sugar transport system permease protein